MAGTVPYNPSEAFGLTNALIIEMIAYGVQAEINITIKKCLIYYINFSIK